MEMVYSFTIWVAPPLYGIAYREYKMSKENAKIRANNWREE